MVGRQSKFLVWINYRVRVTIQDSRMLIGTFLAFDKHMNLVLSDTEEYTKIKAKKTGEVDREKKRSLGLVLLRGENIISMSAESPPSQNNKRFSEIPNLGGQGKTQPTGRGVPMVNQAQSGLSGPGRGVGIPNLMNMMPPIGRGVIPMHPRMQIPHQNIQNIQGIQGMQGLQNNIPMTIQGMGVMQPGIIRPPMMIRPPHGGNVNIGQQQNPNFQG